LGLLLVLGSAGTSSAQSKPADLTATPASVTIMVPAHHQSQPVSVEIISSQAIPATDKLGASMLGDLVRDDSAARIPRSGVQVSVTPDNTDATNDLQ